MRVHDGYQVSVYSPSRRNRTEKDGDKTILFGEGDEVFDPISNEKIRSAFTKANAMWSDLHDEFEELVIDLQIKEMSTDDDEERARLVAKVVETRALSEYCWSRMVSVPPSH